MQYKNMMEFSLVSGNTTANNLGIGFKSINIGDTRISGINFLSASGKVENELTLLGGYAYIMRFL